MKFVQISEQTATFRGADSPEQLDELSKRVDLSFRQLMADVLIYAYHHHPDALQKTASGELFEGDDSDVR
jgi:hypothetical protein